MEKCTKKQARGVSVLQVPERYKTVNKEEWGILCDAGLAYGIGDFTTVRKRSEKMSKFSNEELEWACHTKLQLVDLSPFWGMHWDMNKLKDVVDHQIVRQADGVTPDAYVVTWDRVELYNLLVNGRPSTHSAADRNWLHSHFVRIHTSDFNVINAKRAKFGSRRLDATKFSLSVPRELVNPQHEVFTFNQEPQESTDVVGDYTEEFEATVALDYEMEQDLKQSLESLEENIEKLQQTKQKLEQALERHQDCKLQKR